ncbi:MAG TPA: ATPase, T2SS/T4P/T4SS family [Patescibacteria group bacterium]|nr:ATPase, T2SS/T4P/T4SS family [Patescibacteria group bacterium]
MGRFLGNAEKFSDKQVAETLELLVTHGYKRGASDIHIEPHERFVLVRYRIDGALRGIHKLPRQALVTVMAELKKIAGLQVQETHMPQEGQYDVRIGDTDVTVRVSIMPVYGGEKAVLHLAVRMGQPESLEALGFWGAGLKTIQSVLASPHGLLVVSGPRHSGIHSTIFSVVQQLNSPMVSIATVELSTKHRLPGVTHTYLTASGMTVLDGLRAALKQDPNIIMLGDIPDGQTAELAVHAATTGHLVIAGMRADGAVAGVLRMRVTGVEPFMLVTALRASIGQRLVRALCPDCRERYAVSPEEHRSIRQNFGITTPASLKRIHELELQAAKSGLGDPRELSTTPAQITHLWRASSEGCETCHHTGFQGRTALVEVLAASEEVQKGLMNRDVTSVAALHKQALKDGFIPLALDGFIKVLRGQTTIKEVLHAAGTVSNGTLS